MSTPIGHTLMGLTLARRLGVRSPLGMASTVVIASFPDTDVIAGLALHRDPWKLHRKATHTFGFATAAGMVAGLTGIVSAGTAEGDRDVLMDAMVGAAICASHVVLDKVPFPHFPTRNDTAGRHLVRNTVFNWIIESAVYGALAWKLWPRERTTADRARA